MYGPVRSICTYEANVPVDSLRLIFTWRRPALAPEAQVAVGGSLWCGALKETAQLAAFSGF
jgi:predicted RNA polymerase sigma factor